MLNMLAVRGVRYACRPSCKLPTVLRARHFSTTVHESLTATPTNEVDKTRKRLYYQSKERGMLENDLLLGNFARKFLPEMTPTELKEYDAIIQETDPDIFAWITGKQTIPSELQTSTMNKLLTFCKENPIDYRKANK